MDSMAQTAQAVATSVTAPITAPITESFSLWEIVLKGGPIMIPIGILSVAAVYIFFERFFTINKMSRIDVNFMNQIRDHVHSGNTEAARDLCKKADTPISHMIEKGIIRIGRPIRDIEGAIENSGKLEIYKMEKNVGLLGTIAGLAPMLGFLGTIFGVIKIFYEIHLQNSLEIGTISGGLYVKMVTSAAGLLVGMVAYAGFQFLQLKIDRAINQMEVKAIEFIDLLEEPAGNK